MADVPADSYKILNATNGYKEVYVEFDSVDSADVLTFTSLADEITVKTIKYFDLYKYDNTNGSGLRYLFTITSSSGSLLDELTLKTGSLTGVKIVGVVGFEGAI